MGPVDTLLSSVCTDKGLGGATGAELAAVLASAAWLFSDVTALGDCALPGAKASVGLREMAGTATGDLGVFNSPILGGDLKDLNIPEVSSSSELVKVEQAVIKKQTASRPNDLGGRL
jgi:hypothetical protein